MANKPENLKPFKKGEQRTIDAARKSKRRSFDKIMADEINKLINKSNKDGLTNSEAMAIVAYKHFLKGNSRPMDMLLNRAFGKSREKIEVVGKNDGPIETKNINLDLSDDRAAEILGILEKTGQLKPKPEKASNTEDE